LEKNVESLYLGSRMGENLLDLFLAS